LNRAAEREFSYESMTRLAEWLDLDPEVPSETWYKRLPGMTVCGNGEFVSTFLTPDQAPHGREIK
jgi:hypothetical protein